MPVVIQFFKDMNPNKIALVGLGILAFIVLFIVFVSKIASHDMAILYSDLDIDSSNKVILELETKKIPYQLLADGAVIKVPKDQVNKLRLNLAQAGVPNKGVIVGYEIFDKEDSIGTTNFAQNVKLARALEGELSRTISAFEQVDKARVHLVLPQREIFSKQRLEPRASIILKLKHNKTLNKSEVAAIGHLVVTAIPELDLKNITIVDTKGTSLKLGIKDAESNFANVPGEEYKVAYENRMKQVIEDLLAQTLGAGKVKAQVAVEMNFDRIVTNSEIYDPNSAVVRSVQSIDEREHTPVSGEDNLDVSVANNIPGGMVGEEQSARFATTEKSDQITNYEISKTIKNHISETGVIKKLSVGILVDGTYKLNPTTKEITYFPIDKAELDKIANLVKVAIGFNEDRNDKIEVINMQFASDLDLLQDKDSSSWLKDELPNLFQTLVFAIVVLLVLITVIRPIALRAFEVRKNKDEEDAKEDFVATDRLRASVMQNGEEIADLTRRDKSPVMENSAQKINELIIAYPQEAIVVLRKWLNENS